MWSRLPSMRSVGEFILFLVIVLVSGIGVQWANEQLSTPASAVVAGVILTLMAGVGVWWLVYVGPETKRSRGNLLAGLGGAFGVLAIDSVVSGDQYVALGVAIAAGVGAVAGIIWDRYSPVTDSITKQN